MAEEVDDTESGTINLSAPKFSIGDILANYSGGLDKPAYEVVDNINGVYRLKQIPSGNFFTWDYATVERANTLYIPPATPAKGLITIVDYPASARAGETLTITARAINAGDSVGMFALELYDGPNRIFGDGTAQAEVNPGGEFGFNLPYTMPARNMKLTFKAVRYT